MIEEQENQGSSPRPGIFVIQNLIFFHFLIIIYRPVILKKHHASSCRMPK